MNLKLYPRTPRLGSLHHRLKTAKDPDGKSTLLVDKLMVFLEDPPPGTTDRWQAAADLCATHGIPTSRVAIWRFYRTHILHWHHQPTSLLANAA